MLKNKHLNKASIKMLQTFFQHKLICLLPLNAGKKPISFKGGLFVLDFLNETSIGELQF